MTGIVVAAEKEEEVLAAYWESNAAAEERERAKREERALKRWAKLINGLRIRRRLRAEYGEVDDVSLLSAPCVGVKANVQLEGEQHNPMAHGGAPRPARTAGSVIALANKELTSAWADRVRDASPETQPEAPPPEPEARAAEPMEYMETEGAPSSGVGTPKAPGTPKITLRIRSQAATPAVPTPDREPEPEATVSGRPRRAAANGKKAPAKAAKAAPKKRATRGRKRKASDEEDESEAEESEDELPSRRNGRRSSPPPAPTGRVLRSRAAKPSLREPSSELSLDEEEE